MIQEILQGKKSSCKRMKARSKEQLTTMMAGVIVFKNAEAVESLGRDDRGKTKKRGTKKIRTGEELEGLLPRYKHRYSLPSSDFVLSACGLDRYVR
jgi:hypothetical protein